MRNTAIFSLLSLVALIACGDDATDPTGDAGADIADTADVVGDTDQELDPADSEGSDTTTDVADIADDVADDAELDGDADGSEVSNELAPGEVTFAAPGSFSEESGRGSFTFGAATAAAQIEDGLTNNDWYYWTLPEAEGGLGRGKAFVGDASGGYTRAIDDIELMVAAGLDAYRFSIDWSRIEPQRDVIDDVELAHYSAFIDALLDAGITPIITVHHFSNPIWVEDFREPNCTDETVPTDTNLCGWSHPVGGPLVAAELAQFAGLLAAEFGDRVDIWCTLNEPVNYMIATYGGGFFPPGRSYLLSDFDRLIDAMRNYALAHVLSYDAIKAADTGDVDADGEEASVGFTLSVIKWQAARSNRFSTNPVDVAAANRVEYIYHHALPTSFTAGTFDADLDGTADEEHPEWANHLDWLGIQYYFRTGVTGATQMVPQIGASFCFSGFDFGSCLPVADETKWVPSMGYEYYEPGIYDILVDIGTRWPDVPLVVTEAGIATEVGERRAENVVRTLEQIQRAIDAGIDVRGYLHWSLFDNFEWAEGFEPRFGLYRVDFETYERTPTLGATVLGEIAGARTMTEAQRALYGGLGPMTPEGE
jgi:beta-glucosidase